MTGAREVLEHRVLREALGAYALGQLDEPLHDAVSEHLAACATCPVELAELDPLVRALRSVRPDDVRPADLGVPPGLDDRIRRALPAGPASASAPARPRRTALVTAVAAAAAVAAAVAVTTAVVRDDSPAPSPAVIAVPGVQATEGVVATAGLVDHTWGLEIKLRATGLTSGERFSMWVVADDGSRREAGEFVGVGSTEIVCDMSSSVLLDDAASFRVMDAAGREVIAADVPS
jgi:hypothetical protein